MFIISKYDTSSACQSVHNIFIHSNKYSIPNMHIHAINHTICISKRRTCLCCLWEKKLMHCFVSKGTFKTIFQNSFVWYSVGIVSILCVNMYVPEKQPRISCPFPFCCQLVTQQHLLSSFQYDINPFTETESYWALQHDVFFFMPSKEQLRTHLSIAFVRD